VIAPLKLSQTAQRVLRAVRKQPLSVQAAADAVGLSRRAVAGALRILERRELVSRRLQSRTGRGPSAETRYFAAPAPATATESAPVATTAPTRPETASRLERLLNRTGAQ
jgi:DNA-binding transcriptional ArsR family regulator